MKSGKVCSMQTFNSVNNPRAADQPWASATSELVGLMSATSVSATSELVGLASATSELVGLSSLA